MSKPEQSGTAFTLIPRWLDSRDNVARAAGLTVTRTIEKGHPGGHAPCVVTRWLGTEQQFRATGLLSPRFVFPLRCRWCHEGILRANVFPTDDGLFEMEHRDNPASKLESRGGGAIQVAYIDHAITYHGTQADLVAAGILTKSQFLPKGEKRQYLYRSGISKVRCLSDGNSWTTKGLPDGTLLFTVEHWGEHNYSMGWASGDLMREVRTKNGFVLRTYP